MRRIILMVCALLLSVSLVPAAAQPDTTVSVLQVVDTAPLSGQELGAQSPITVYFDREIDCATVETAASITPTVTGEFSCDGTAITFTPGGEFSKETTYTLTFTDALRGADGSQLLEAYELTLTTAGFLQVTATLPTEGSTEAVADTVLTIIFNRPVVPLGLPSDSPELPDPLTITPAIEGQGEWINTSIYTFTPDVAWGGGTTYQVTVDDLTAVDGTTLQAPFDFSFTVALPQVLTTLPEQGVDSIRLRPMIQVTFNQPIDRESLESSFYLRLESENTGTVSGTFTWNETDDGFSFQPDDNLQLETIYQYGYPANSVKAAGSEATLDRLVVNFRTVPLPSIISTNPADGTVNPPYGGFDLYFSSPMDPETLNDKITITPAPAIEPRFFYRDWSNSLGVTFNPEPGTTYTISIAPGMTDIYGNEIETPFQFSYSTTNYDAELALKVPSGAIGFYDAERDTTGLFLTHRNVAKVDLQLYQVPLLDFVTQLTSDQYYNIAGNYAPRSQNLIRSWSIPNVAPQNVLRYELLDLGAPNAGETSNNLSGSTECAGALATRAKIGDRAVVTADPALRARSYPPDGEVVETLYPGYAFDIVDGPICTNNMLWWGITLRDGSVAWAAEGFDQEYFFEVTIPSASSPGEQPRSTIELEGGALPTGIYLLSASANETRTLGYNDLRHFMVVGNANLTLKAGMDQAAVWVTDVHTGLPLANVPVSLYGISDVTLADNTDANGMVTFEFPRRDDVYDPLAAVVDDGAYFGMGFTEWTDGIDPWRFNVSYNYYPQHYAFYTYTERPIYRPGQPVYFRGIVRQKDDVDYLRPPFDTIPVKIYDGNGNEVFNQDIELTDYGSFSGVFQLAEDAPLGYYRIDVQAFVGGSTVVSEGGGVGFDVAEYRLPEYQVKANAAQPEVVQGDTVTVTVDSTYFFGGPVVNANVDYTISSSDFYFNYDGQGSYSFFDYTRDDGSRAPMFYSYDPFYGAQVATGSGETDGNGKFIIELPAEIDDSASKTWAIEATVRDESGQSVSGRTTLVIHSGLVYIGVAPDFYVGTVGQNTRLNMIAVDWDSDGVAGQDIQVEVVERRWSSVQTLDRASGQITYDYEVENIPVADGSVTTDADGKAVFDFVPPRGGVYQAKITTTDADGNTVVASTTMWVSGNDYIAWRVSNDNTIELIADRDLYDIGETAKILITSPFQGSAQALVTVERAGVMKTELITLDTNSVTYELPITEDYAPNVYVSVIIVKGVDENNKVAAFRAGLIGLQVNNERKQLTIELESSQPFASPGETLTYTVRTTDYQGNPVQAEVGVALTDLASLSIGTPNAGPILDAFYSTQPLSIRTSTPLTINTDYLTQYVLDVIKGGGGGGGGGGVFEIRQEFLDTPYWNAAIETDENGMATFEVELPDNLTTWRLDARALTNGDEGEMLVGQETFDLISTKPVLVRPVTPRFFVVNDKVVLAAVVNNNSGAEQTVEVSIEANGVTLESDVAQTVTIPNGSSARVEWNIIVDDVENVEVIFFANANDGEFTDASRPAVGLGDNLLLPVYRYEAPEYTGTGGVLREAGTREERIVLPERFSVSDAQITLKLEESLAATTIAGLDYLRGYQNESIETTVSRFLPNAVTLQALDALGVQDDALRENTFRAVNIGLQRLAAQQKSDGGWGWYVNDDSNPLVTAWAVIGLMEVQKIGVTVDQRIIDRAVSFLQSKVTTRNAPGGRNGMFVRDQQVFILYALARAGQPDNAAMSNMYDQRDLLSIYSKALLALSLDPSDTVRINALLDDIFADAIVSANGVHWEESDRDRYGWNSNTRTTAIVLQALVRYRPQNDLLPGVVRWLIVARNGDAWETTQETAWSVMALTDWMVASGELEPDYTMSADVNGEELINEPATPEDVLLARVFEIVAEQTNSVAISRTEGNGALYYTAYLKAFVPVPDVEPLNRGIIVQREYTTQDGETVTEARVGDIVQVHLTIIAPNDLYYLVVDDPLPAGTEGINPGLATSAQIGTQPGLDYNDPLSYGWGWWWFSNIEFRDERVVLSATYLPAGTYEYVYSLRVGVEGEYNVIPTTAREFYFPEVYGRGEGTLFTVLPEAQ